jgi:diguanylate cyclase (GGDEF)-like protein/PAS domain S-box-containing protein
MSTPTVSYEALLDHLPDGVCFLGQDGRISYWNNGAERITGFSRGQVLGQPVNGTILRHVNRHGEAPAAEKHPLETCLADGLAREEETYLQHRDGHVVPVFMRISPIENSLGEVIGAMEVFSDNSLRMQARHRIEELEEMALVCPVTGVGNRRYAEMAIKNAFAALERFGWPCGLLFVDLDDFKGINDAHGHAVGDEILRMAAHALRASLRSFDFVGRWGGEEFLVLLPNVTDEVLAFIAERCRESIAGARYQHEGREIRITASIGAVMAAQGETPEACLARADRFMYAAKRLGRNRVVLDEAVR